VEAYQAWASYGQHELSYRGNMTSFQSFTAASRLHFHGALSTP
jgi:hypothetical protein